MIVSDDLRYGVGMAQRGWLTTEDVITAWPLTRLRDFIDTKRNRIT
jgi:DNA polymerase (family 10)